jgi:amino acid adenylation domain-containing protein
VPEAAGAWLRRSSTYDAAARPALVQPSRNFVRFETADIAQSIPDRFEQQVRRFPHKLAVKTTQESCTYTQLNALANQIGRLIVAQLGSANRPLALLFDQSVSLIAAILASLKAGKMYVPLDPMGSTSRNTSIVVDSTAAAILTESANLHKAQAMAPPDVRVFNLDAMDEGYSTENLDVDLESDRYAYIFYTSGSTGKPKGLADTHRNVLHNVMRYTNSLRISPDDRLTLLQAANFSGSVSSLFCALLNGAASFPLNLQSAGPDCLASWLCQEKITIYHSVPSIFRLLATGKHSYPWLRIVRLEGDQASPRDIELYRTHFPDTCILVNGLGATECGIVRQYFVNKETPVPEGVVPVGFPVEDMEILLLDDSGHAVGPDSVGEIAVRSCYLAPGYWRRPDLTEAAFMTDPQGRPERTYRTGDLGRMRMDGCLEYLGRKHFQLRIRGRWVEIADVEKALHSVGGFKDVLVVPVEDRGSGPRLVAYVVPQGSHLPSVDELRHELGKRLPAHMIPAAFVRLAALPLNSFGKVDRQALPPPGRTRPALKEAVVHPRTPVEQTLGRIVGDVLGLEEIGIHDDFFDLGGDSLLAFQVISRIYDALDVELPLRTFFEAPTIAGLARRFAESQVEPIGSKESIAAADSREATPGNRLNSGLNRQKAPPGHGL